MINEVESAKVYTDFSGFDALKKSARHNDPDALHKVAKQFESLFIQMVMKSMRAANEYFSEDSMFNSNDGEFYQEMYDQQMSVSLGQGKGLGLADVLERQMSQQIGKKTENSVQTPLAPPIQKMVQALDAVKDAKNAKPLLAKIPQIEEKAIPAEPITAAVAAKPIKAPLYEDPVAFVKAVWPSAINYAKKLGVDPKMLVAQAALETGWGKSIIKSHDGESTHNLFNIKADKTAHHSTHVSIPTIEYSDGIAVRRHETFKKYHSISDSFSDYVGLLTQNARYSKALDHAHNPKNYIHSLQAGGYATDPHYADKVYKIYQGDVLHNALSKIR